MNQINESERNIQGEGTQTGECWARLRTMLVDCDSVVEAYVRSLIAAGPANLKIYMYIFSYIYICIYVYIYIYV